MVVTRMQKIVPSKPNDAWSMDFVADQLADGSKFRAPTAVDEFTKEALAIKVGQRLRGEHVVSALNRIAARRGAPRHIFVDNGSEFSGRLLDMWAYHHQSKIDFSRPGKPTDNCHIGRLDPIRRKTGSGFGTENPSGSSRTFSKIEMARRSQAGQAALGATASIYASCDHASLLRRRSPKQRLRFYFFIWFGVAVIG